VKRFFIIFIISALLFSCREANHVEFPVIPVDINSDVSLPLSAITDEITAIELEDTDESLINPDRIRSFHLFENHIILHEQDEILVFSMDGKFIRSIGSKGQGPGEFFILLKLAIDEKNKRLIAVDRFKIICYDLNGKFLFQSSAIFDKGKRIYDLSIINGELFALVDQLGTKETKVSYFQPQLYKMSDDLQIIDSLTIRKTYYEKLDAFGFMLSDLILHSDSKAYIYCPEHSWQLNIVVNKILPDTLYRLEKNSLIPDLKLNFKNRTYLGDDLPIEIGGIYRSSRYIFAAYLNRGFFRFCYDTKTGKGYNMKNGFTDDFHQIEKRINIRPFASNTELFYYWHTHMNEADINTEPNPTLYIGRLKK